MEVPREKEEIKEKHVAHTHTHTHTHIKLQRVLGKHVQENTRLKPPLEGPMELRRSRQPWDATALGVPMATGALG